MCVLCRYLLVLLTVHGGPGELGGLEAVVEVPLAFGVGEEEDLRIRADESDSLSGVNLGATETTELGLQNHGCSAMWWSKLQALMSPPPPLLLCKIPEPCPESKTLMLRLPI